MRLFRRTQRSTYDCEKLKPAIRCSICTAERVLGFKDRQSGHFTEVMLVSSEKDIERFKEQYGVKGEIEEFY